jgi:hypothetical protein
MIGFGQGFKRASVSCKMLQAKGVVEKSVTKRIEELEGSIDSRPP